jgi:hypothetical protein
MANKVTKYLLAELKHAVLGAAPLKVAQERLDICLGCEHRQIEYKGVTDPKGVGYCDSCGCGATERAHLEIKTMMAGAACPKGKWGTSQGTGGTFSTAAEAIGGVFSTAKSFVFDKKSKATEAEQQKIDLDKIRKEAAERMNEFAARHNWPLIDPAKIQITFGTKDSPEGEEKVG